MMMMMMVVDRSGAVMARFSGTRTIALTTTHRTGISRIVSTRFRSGIVAGVRLPFPVVLLSRPRRTVMVLVVMMVMRALS